MKFSEQPPSKQWVALKYRGQKFAEVWFKPEGEPFGLTFRLPQESFRIPGIAEQLTIGNLLMAVAIVPDEVESWRQGDVSHSGMDGSNPHLGNALPPPAQHVTHLEIYVRLKPPPEARNQESRVRNQKSVDRSQESSASSPIPDPCLLTPDSCELEISSAKWQDLETRWKTILGLEAAMDTLRISMEGLLVEMESLWKKPLTTEEKTYAPRADVAQWNKAKNRVHNALPKMKDVIHRSIWAMGSPERKRLEMLYNDHIQPHLPFPQIDEVLKQLDELRKDRQVLSAQGKTVYQECRGISAELQGALTTLQSNTVNAKKKKVATGGLKGRFFKK